MMGERNWEIILYGGELSEIHEYAELVPIYTDKEQKKWFGDLDPNMLPLVAGSWSMDQEQYVITNGRASSAIKARYTPGDLILLTGGYAQKPILDTLPHPQYQICEWAAGYSGVMFSDRSLNPTPWVCFESNAWRHYLYGKYGIDDGRWFDAVIPNFFDPEEWRLYEKEDYLVFVGRLIARKGPHVAAEIAREMGLPLLVAGSGMAAVSRGRILCQDGTEINGDVHYMGTVGWEDRSKLMGRARVLIAPTQYIEPFGAVVVEAMLSGTPSIATDWGAFPELLPPERIFRTLGEGCQAVERAMGLYPERLQQEALGRWSLEVVAPMYERWFHELATLWKRGWYETSVSADRLNSTN